MLVFFSSVTYFGFVVLMSFDSIYTTGLTKYDLCTNLASRL